MIDTFCLVRRSRNGPLLLAVMPYDLSSADAVATDEPILLDHQGEQVVGFVAVPSEQLRYVPGIRIEATVLAAGYGSSEVVAAIARDNAEALQIGRNLLGTPTVLSDAAWHWDRSRLTFTLADEPGDERESVRERLASAFRAEIRFVWPGGEEIPDLGEVPVASAGREESVEST